MRIATFNVNGVRSRLSNLTAWLKGDAPDIVCLQELKAPDEMFPLAAISDAGYGAIWHGQKSWNGVAILARGDEPKLIRRGLPGDPDDTHSRYIEARGARVDCRLPLPAERQPGARARSSITSCAGSIGSPATRRTCSPARPLWCWRAITT